MAIALSEYEWPAKLVLSGHEASIMISAGQSLKVETSPEGEEILNAICPMGKTWTAKIIIEITETNL